MQAEGVTFRTSIIVAALEKDSKATNWATYSVSPDELKQDFDAVILCGGSEQSRDLPVPGREVNWMACILRRSFCHSRTK